MKKRLLIGALIGLLGRAASAEVPVYTWGQSFGGSLRDDIADIDADEAGYVYATGVIRGDVDVNGDGRVDVTTDSGAPALYLAKIRGSDHQLVWVDYLRGDYSRGTAVAVDPHSGAVYVTGTFKGSVSFNPLWDQPDLSCPCPRDSSSAGLLVAYNSYGQVRWARAFDGTATDPNAVVTPTDVTYGSGYLTLVGSFWNEFDTDGDGDADLRSAGQDDGFVISLISANGETRWARQVKGREGSDIVRGVASAPTTDIPLQVAIAGYALGDVDFDGDGDPDLRTSPDDSAAFLASYDWDGSLVWVTAQERSGGKGVAWDFRHAFYLLSESHQPIVGGSGDPRPNILSKYAAGDGRRLWSRVVSRSGNAIGEAVAADAAGNPHVTGFFERPLEMNGDGLTDLRSRGRADLFLASYTADGLYRWAVAAGGGGLDAGASLVVGPSNEIFVGGLSTSRDLDATGDGVTDVSATTGGALLLRYDPQGFWLGDFDFICDEIDCSWFVPIELISGVADIELGVSSNLAVTGVFMRDDLKPSLIDVTKQFRLEFTGCVLKEGVCYRYVREEKGVLSRPMVRVEAKDPKEPVRFTLRARDLADRQYEHPPTEALLPECGPPPAAEVPWPPGNGTPPHPFPPGLCKARIVTGDADRP